jgi:outer membrane immunogenic protein
MTRLMFFGIAAGLISAAALAADLPSYDPYRPEGLVDPVSARYDWTGFYSGAQLGYAWGGADAEDVTAGDSFSYDPDGWVGGVHLGYNWQRDAVVAGLEGDLELAHIEDSDENGDIQVSSDVDWQGSLRGRVGASFGNMLIYGTAGAAYAGFESRIDNEATSETDSFDNSRWGWTAGAGLEVGMTESVSVRAEYRYSDFGTKTVASDDAAPGDTFEFDESWHSLRLGASYNF